MCDYIYIYQNWAYIWLRAFLDRNKHFSRSRVKKIFVHLSRDVCSKRVIQLWIAIICTIFPFPFLLCAFIRRREMTMGHFCFEISRCSREHVLVWTILIVLSNQQRVIMKKAFLSLAAYHCSENAEWSPPPVISDINFIHSFQLNEREGYQRLFLSKASAQSKARPQHRELRALLFPNSECVLLRPVELWTMKSCEMGPTVYRPYPRRLESLSLCRYYYKGSTFDLAIFKKTLSVGPAGLGSNPRPPALWWSAPPPPTPPPPRKILNEMQWINLSGGSSTSVSIFRFLLDLILRARAASILRIVWKSSSVRS